MPIYTPSGFLDITNATLRTSNIESQNINFTSSGGSISVGPAFDFQQVSAIGNTTPETIQFTNATTSFVTSGNVEVGKNISVVDATVSSNMSVGGNVTVSSNLSVSGNVTVGKNLFLTSNTTTSINSNVIVEHSGPHPREPTTPVLKTFPDVDFTQDKFDYNDSTLTYTQAGYVVTASSQSSGSEVWRLFDDGDWNQEAVDKYTTASSFQYNPSSNPNSLGDVSGEWFKVKFPRKVIINKFTLNVGDSINNGLVAFKVLGSDDDTNWTEVKDVSGLTSASYTIAAPFVTTVESVSSVAYRYYAVVITRLLGVNQVSIREVEFYGYEEDLPDGDTSLDTTFTSILNRPQTGGVKVYVDGDTLDNKVTGPTPTGTDAIYDSTGKYWELTGTQTSNVTVEANTFLEGDAPHSVSMWFNSSNLEANTANTCVFTISDQENLDSYNLDLQSNTWHNLTYSYQGEGGSRVTYLDGRKVSEDQAEDTFGEYPPFAMTGYSQGGYVVSASDTFQQYSSYLAFNKIVNTSADYWFAGDDTGGVGIDGYTGSVGGDHSYIGSDNLGGYTGIWVKLEMPHKLALSYLEFYAVNTSMIYTPRDFYVIGSNDDITWDLIHRETSTAADNTFTSGRPITTNSADNHNKYKYIAIVIDRTVNDNRVGIGEIKLYGHRENDLVRLPDPTRVLKYPHIAMTGPAQRGYVASASGNHSNGNHPTWKAFDGVITNDWQIDGGRYSNSGGVYTHNAGETTVTNVQSRVGDWVQLESPHKIRVKTMKFTPIATYGQERSPATGVLVGSNDDGSTWTEIKVFDVTTDGTPTSYTAASPTTLAIDSGSNSTPGYYKIHRLIWLTLYTASQTTYADRASVADLELYGTEEASSVPIQIGGGNIDRVANFRVYDKFVEEDQALEIWDAQKDTFRGVKNSMTLHKGRLGIGTTEPEGRLAVLDEPHNLEEFPPKAMTDYKTYFEGHGEFCASASTEQNTTTTLGWHVFAKVRDDINKRWRSNSSVYDNTVNPATTNSAAATFDGIGVRGEWILLEMPYNICLKKYEFIGFTGQTPHTGQIWGSDDNGTTWHHVDTFQNAVGSLPSTYPNITNTFHVLGNTKYYSRYVFIVEKLTSADDAASMSSLKYFGTREQRQSVLHDGQLTLTKNLDVPRIGPPLDADDTPRRDRLVVEYNTSSNPTFEGAVRDTSGRGNDGVFYGNATYDAAEKALVFDGTGRVQGTHNFLETPNSNCHTFSVNLWFNHDIADPYYNVIFHTGGTTGNSLQMFVNSSDQIGVSKGGYDINTSIVSIHGSWYHVVWTYPGGDVFNASKIYVNGVLQTLTTAGSDPVLHKVTSSEFALGDQVDALAGTSFNGSISNFKLYDYVLTASEVKTLYDMGRNGSVANPQPLHIAAPLYAPGVPVQIVSKVYKKQVGYSSTSAYRNIKELDISIKPKFANSKILLHWMINGELHQDNVIRVARDGSYIIHGYNETQGLNRWSGIAAAMYDQNEASTPHNFCIDTYDEPGGTNTYNYQIYIGSSSTTSYPAYINRTYNSAGANAYEAGICFMSATEIAQ